MNGNETRLVSIVDDDESLRRSVKNLLTSVGFQVETFASAEAFLQSAHRADTRCVVLDLRMPGMSGLDLLMHLAATGSPIPVVILTSHSDDEARPVQTIALLRLVLWLAPPLSYALASSNIRMRDHILGSAIGLIPPVLAVTLLSGYL